MPLSVVAENIRTPLITPEEILNSSGVEELNDQKILKKDGLANMGIPRELGEEDMFWNYTINLHLQYSRDMNEPVACSFFSSEQHLSAYL